MADNRSFADPIEIERYELDEQPTYRFEVSRRSFVKLFGAGIAVVLVSPEVSGQRGRSDAGDGPSETERVAAWLHIDEDGKVIVYTGKVEVGQNIRTSLAQTVAEQLHVAVDTVTMIMGDTDRVPYDRGTFGSQSTPRMGPQLKKAAAAAREMLLDLAADRLGVERSTLKTTGGSVTGADGQAIPYGTLTRGQQLLRSITDDEPVTPPNEWSLAGSSYPKVEGRTFVTGAHKYASDIQRPNMLVGKVLRPPSFGAELLSLDASAAERLPGVTVVHDGNFVGVFAPDEPAAGRALTAIEAEWESTPQVSRDTLFAHLKETATPRRTYTEKGSVEDVFATAHQTLNETYTVDYIAHTPLEPRAAVAEWATDGKLTVWTGTQRPFGVRTQLSRTFKIKEDRVRVIMPDTGSGYGGKHTGEAAIEAARLAKAAGKPVRVVWTREEEFTWAYFRPAGVIEIRSAVNAKGDMIGWVHHNYNSGGSSIRSIYDVPNQHVEFHRSDSPLRQGSYRSLASTANIFARETHVDELAHSVGEDPLAYRLRHLSNDRMKAVFSAAAERFEWGTIKPATGRGFGMGGGTDKGGYVAACAEVDVNRRTGRVRVVRVVQAFECGAVVNPDHLRNQVEGCIVQGLGGALFERIDFRDGRIRNASLTKYRVPRFSDVPDIDVVILDRKDLPSAGAGETPIAAIAPAVGNAIFDATGIRLRSLPLVPEGFRT